MSEYVITNGKIYTEEQTIDKGFVHIKEGKILSVGSGHLQEEETDTNESIQYIDAKGQHI